MRWLLHGEGRVPDLDRKRRHNGNSAPSEFADRILTAVLGAIVHVHGVDKTLDQLAQIERKS